MLASDVNNTEFVGAIPNPDDLLHVEFYLHSRLDVYKTQELGKEVRDAPIPYVRIMKPGDQTSIIETPVREDHKARWPQKWLYFQMKQGMVPMEQIPGWQIEDWSFLNEEQKRELKYLRFSTVEQIAGASDAQVQRLGLGGLGLREQAKKALKERAIGEAQAEIEARDKQIAELKAKDEQREKELAEIRALLQAQREVGTQQAMAEAAHINVVVEQPKKRRGRPPKARQPE